MDRRISCFLFFFVNFSFLFFFSTADASQFVFKSTKDHGVVRVSSLFKHVTTMKVEREKSDEPPVIELPYSSKALEILKKSILCLPDTARNIKGVRIKTITRPVYVGSLGKRRDIKGQIILVNEKVRFYIKSQVESDETSNLREAYLAACDLQIPSLMNAYASLLCDRLIGQARTKCDENRDQLVNTASQIDWYNQLEGNRKEHIQKHLVLFKLGIRERTISDMIGLSGQPCVGHSLNLSGQFLTSLEGLDLILESDKVKKLDLSKNSILGIQDDPNVVKQPFSQFPNLRKLNLSRNQLSRLPGCFFKGLKNMDTLYLSNNCIEKLHVQVFSGLHCLEHLSLEHNQIYKLERGIFTDLEKLSYLSLNNNEISTLDAKVLSPLKNLHFLYMEYNSLVWLPKGVFNGLVLLERLELSNNRLVSLPQTLFWGLENLLQLGLANNKLFYISKESLKDLCHLHGLFLNGNPLVFMEHFITEHLRVIDISKTKLTKPMLVTGGGQQIRIFSDLEQ